MKKLAIITLLASSLFLVACGQEKPMTEAEQASSYNMTVEEFRDMKDAAARMNMSIEDHMKMVENDSSHGEMDMNNSSDEHMVEEDGMEMENNK